MGNLDTKSLVKGLQQGSPYKTGEQQKHPKTKNPNNWGTKGGRKHHQHFGCNQNKHWKITPKANKSTNNVTKHSQKPTKPAKSMEKNENNIGKNHTKTSKELHPFGPPRTAEPPAAALVTSYGDAQSWPKALAWLGEVGSPEEGFKTLGGKVAYLDPPTGGFWWFLGKSFQKPCVGGYWYCMGFAQHRPCRGKKWAEKGREQESRGSEEGGGPGRLPDPSFMRSICLVFGVMLKNWLHWGKRF